MTRPSFVLEPLTHPHLEEPVRRWPRLKRPDGWSPRWGERVWFARGGDHRPEIVRIGFGIRDDRYPIAVRGGTHGARILGTAPLSRLWPMKGWEVERERMEARNAPED